MLLPYATERPPERLPWMVWVLFAVQILAAAVTLLSGHATVWIQWGGITPSHFRVTTLFTYILLHESWGHLAANLFYLWVFGAGVEACVGPWLLLALYLAGGIFGGALQALTTQLLLSGYQTPTIVGASAAVAALIGLFAVRYYRARLSIEGLPFRPHVVVLVMLFALSEMAAGLWQVLSATNPFNGAAHWAHIGGFLFGLTCGYLLRLDRAGRRAYLRKDAAEAMTGASPGDAIHRWETVLTSEPGSVTARLELGRAWLLLGDTEQASNEYGAALMRQLAMGRRREMVRIYLEMQSHALPLTGLAAPLRIQVADSLEGSSEYHLAAELYRQIFTEAPTAPEAQNALYKLIELLTVRLNRPQEAKILARLFKQRYPASSLPMRRP